MQEEGQDEEEEQIIEQLSDYPDEEVDWAALEDSAVEYSSQSEDDDEGNEATDTLRYG